MRKERKKNIEIGKMTIQPPSQEDSHYIQSMLFRTLHDRMPHMPWAQKINCGHHIEYRCHEYTRGPSSEMFINLSPLLI